MTQVLVLVRNVQSHDQRLDFGEFTISPVGHRFSELRDVFSSNDVYQSDWILEKRYSVVPPGPIGSSGNVGGIPNDIEDILFLFRLYKVGDIAFARQATILPNGDKLNQYPYRAMNALNSNSVPVFEFTQEECESWKAFANGIRQSQSWTADWFDVARRFILYAGAKEFNPQWDDVDRILDYATALEAAIVPEKDYNTRRISRRAAALIAPDDAAEQEIVVKFVKKVYDIRSSIVHGSKLSDKSREWLFENSGQVELRVRQVLVAAVQRLPAGEEDRRTALARMYDPTDEDRGESAFQKFQEIRTEEVRKAIAAKITRLVQD